jgi:hypothetical protein
MFLDFVKYVHLQLNEGFLQQLADLDFRLKWQRENKTPSPER